MRSNIRAGQSNIVAGSQAIQEATAQFRGSNCFEERRGFMGNEEKKIHFDDITEAFPAFVTIIMMPLTYSIAEGIVLGVLTYVLLKLLAGKYRELNLTICILSILCILKYVFI